MPQEVDHRYCFVSGSSLCTKETVAKTADSCCLRGTSGWQTVHAVKGLSERFRSTHPGFGSRHGSVA